MIEQLSVKDYVLFDHAVIDFKDRTMSVITGETGAGKSLLIDAIGYLSGGRLPRNVVRKGAQRAVLQMVLSHPNAQVKALLEENGYELEEDEELIITRTITSAGKSRITINDQTSTNGFVRKITDLMIDVHSQMDTLKLMDPDVQLELLDRFAKTDELRQQTAEAFDALSKIAREIRKLKPKPSAMRNWKSSPENSTKSEKPIRRKANWKSWKSALKKRKPEKRTGKL